MKVSVVTPSFNQGRFIARTLESVARQTGASIEHLVLDAGSSDDTVEILRRSRPPVRWVSEKDAGQADAVNKGIAASQGEILGWLNSDDVYYPDTIERVVAAFAAHPEADVVYGMADHIDVEDRAFEIYPTAPWSFERLTQACFICQPAAFFRRRVVGRHGALDASLRYCMDYEYWLRLGKAGVRFAYLEEKLAGSRLYPETKTLDARLEVHAEINDMLARTLGRVPDRWLVNYAYARVREHAGAERDAAASKARVLVAALAAMWRWNRRLPGPAFWKRALSGVARSAP
jgi:glycosyltransferase involved in cell wall biosynthesis